MADTRPTWPQKRWALGLRLFGAPALLVVVALIQIHGAVTQRQSTWKGGGFGMFASIDSPTQRFVRCFLITSQGELPVPLPRGASHLVVRALVKPNRTNMAHLAAHMRSDSDWMSRHLVPNSRARLLAQVDLPTKEDGDRGSSSGRLEEPLAASAVRLEIWRKEFDSSSARLRARLLAQVTTRRAR